jgi:hypothetical protein
MLGPRQREVPGLWSRGVSTVPLPSPHLTTACKRRRFRYASPPRLTPGVRPQIEKDAKAGIDFP